MHPLAQHDLTHNRLTHSVEVASVGRSLGNRVGVMLHNGGFLPQGNTPSDIGAVVQVACLAHDLGNPPFGHTGEDALRDWFRRPEHQIYLNTLNEAERNDIQTYEGNAHSLRIVASLEMYPEAGGMRLTAAAIGALLSIRGQRNIQTAERNSIFIKPSCRLSVKLPTNWGWFPRE